MAPSPTLTSLPAAAPMYQSSSWPALTCVVPSHEIVHVELFESLTTPAPSLISATPPGLPPLIGVLSLNVPDTLVKVCSAAESAMRTWHTFSLPAPAVLLTSPVSVKALVLMKNPPLSNVRSRTVRPVMSLEVTWRVVPRKTRSEPVTGAVPLSQLAPVLHLLSAPRPVHT